MAKILMMHHIVAPHHARLRQRDDCQAARLLVLAAGAVGDDGNAQILRDKLLDGGDCCFSERMRKLFRKNEKNVLRFCNKKAKEKRRLQRVKKPM